MTDYADKIQNHLSHPEATLESNSAFVSVALWASESESYNEYRRLH